MHIHASDEPHYSALDDGKENLIHSYFSLNTIVSNIIQITIKTFLIWISKVDGSWDRCAVPTFLLNL